MGLTNNGMLRNKRKIILGVTHCLTYVSYFKPPPRSIVSVATVGTRATVVTHVFIGLLRLRHSLHSLWLLYLLWILGEWSMHYWRTLKNWAHLLWTRRARRQSCFLMITVEHWADRDPSFRLGSLALLRALILTKPCRTLRLTRPQGRAHIAPVQSFVVHRFVDLTSL